MLQIHTNPCFHRPRGEGEKITLKKEVPCILEHNDEIGLLPDKLFYRVVCKSQGNQPFWIECYSNICEVGQVYLIISGYYVYLLHPTRQFPTELTVAPVNTTTKVYYRFWKPNVHCRHGCVAPPSECRCQHMTFITAYRTVGYHRPLPQVSHP